MCRYLSFFSFGTKTVATKRRLALPHCNGFVGLGPPKALVNDILRFCVDDGLNLGLRQHFVENPQLVDITQV